MSLLESRIESLGVYVPEEAITTDDLLARCRRRPALDLERITGIRQRRLTETQYASDLAVRAATRALLFSKYTAADLGMVICTGISKHNRSRQVDVEPGTSLLIRKAIGASNAHAFDLVNACAGLFNGVLVMDSFLRRRLIRCGMVVSGEHNTPLVQTATREILFRFDKQVASLTLGDCGAALILERTGAEQGGFHYLESVTGARHNGYCYARPSRRGPGGALFTKARALQRKGAEHFPYYLKKAVEATGWALDDIDYGIAHQVSVRGIERGVEAVAAFLGGPVRHEYLHNVERYGNTTTTSHFLVLDEFMRNRTIRSGHKLLFVSGASGIVITHATYTMDELAERYREIGTSP